GAEPGLDALPFRRGQRAGSDDVDEPRRQMRQSTGQDSASLGLAVDAQRRLGTGLQPRRRDLLAAVGADPVGPLLDARQRLVDFVELTLEGVDQAQALGALGGSGSGIGEALPVIEVGAKAA